MITFGGVNNFPSGGCAAARIVAAIQSSSFSWDTSWANYSPGNAFYDMVARCNGVDFTTVPWGWAYLFVYSDATHYTIQSENITAGMDWVNYVAPSGFYPWGFQTFAGMQRIQILIPPGTTWAVYNGGSPGYAETCQASSLTDTDWPTSPVPNSSSGGSCLPGLCIDTLYNIIGIDPPTPAGPTTAATQQTWFYNTTTNC